MRAQSYLEIARDKFSVSFLSDYPTSPYLLSSLYSKPFEMSMVANPIGEVCPARQENIASVTREEDKDYDKWRKAEDDILFKYWMISEFGNDFYNLNDNCIYFLTDSYVIRTDKNKSETGVRLPLPQTIDDFIRDCNRVGIELYWKEEVVKKHFR